MVGNNTPLFFVHSLHLLEATMAHFYTRAINLKRSGGKAEVIDANLRDAAAIAEKIAPYRYPRLSAVKLAGDPNIAPFGCFGTRSRKRRAKPDGRPRPAKGDRTNGRPHRHKAAG